MIRQRRKKLVAFLVTICMLFGLTYPAAYAEGVENIDDQTVSNVLQNDVMIYYVGGEIGTASGKIGESSDYPFATLYDAVQVVNQKSGIYNIVIQGNTTENKAIAIGDGTNAFNVVISNLSVASGSAIAVSGSAIAVSGSAVSASTGTASTGTGFTITSAVSDGCLISVNNNASLTLAGNTDIAAGLTFHGSSSASQAMFYVAAKGTLKLHSGVTIQNNINTNTNSSPIYKQYVKISGGIYNEGYFIMDGGTISGNSSAYYGGVCNMGTFILSGGTITGNSGSDCGGVFNIGTFEMSGGNILNNNSSMASGVYNSHNGVFNMSGGTILNSDTKAYAGVYSASDFTISGNVQIRGVGNSQYVYLCITSLITIGGNLTYEDNIPLRIYNLSPGRQVFGGDADLIKNNYHKFNLNSSAAYSIAENGTLEYHGEIMTYYVDGIVGSDTYSGTSEAPFATINRAVTAVNEGSKVGTIYICSDLTLTKGMNIFGTITIRNLGEKHTIYRGGTFEGSMFYVWNTLILGDSEKDGVDNTISLALDGNHQKVNNGGVIMNEGTLILHNGVSLQNSETNYFGVVLNGNVFTMYGGSINNNTVRNGGGVYNRNTGTFTMKGGSISNNTAEIGGAISNVGKFIMTGGNISDNNASKFGNGVFCESGSFIIRDNALISSSNDVCLSQGNNIDNVITIGGKLLGNAPSITITTVHNSKKAFRTGDQLVVSAKEYNYTAEDLDKISLSDSRYFLNSSGVVNAQLQDSFVTFSANSDLYYTGSEIKPPVSVLLDYTLAEGTDYKVSYDNNTDVGTATICVDGLGNICGQVTKTFTIRKAAIQRIITAAPGYQNFNASEGKSEADLLSTITLSKVNAEYIGGTVSLPITWKLTGGTYNPKGGSYTYTGTPTGNNNIDAGNATLTTKITVNATKLIKPSLDNFVIAKGTNEKATAGELGSSILPVSGTLLVEGTTINYKINWDTQTLNTTIPEESTIFTGNITYTDAPDWATLPSDLTVKRTVSVAAATSFTITASTGNNGSITPNGSVIVNRNADQSFTIIPFPGCVIADVLVDGNSVGAVSSYTFTKVMKNHNISASFMKPALVPTEIPTQAPTPTVMPTITVEPTVTQKPTVTPTQATDKVKVIQLDVSVKVDQDEEGNELNASITISEDEVLDMAGTGDNSEQTKITIPISSDELAQQIKDNKASKTNINVTVPSSLMNNNSIAACDIMLDSDIIRAVKNTGKDIKLAVQYEKGIESYSWTFNGNDLAASDKSVTDINLSLEVEKIEKNTDLSDLLDQGTQNKNDSSNSLIIRFSHHGDLPSQANVKIYVGDMGFTTGQKIYLYYFNSETGKLETLPYSSDFRVDSDGYVSINIVHCSEYVLMPQKAGSTIITSLLNQINVTPKKTTLYLEGTGDSTAPINTILPSTLELVEDLKDKTSGSAVGAATASYQSSNKNIVVVVSNKGKITAKGTGKAVISVTVKLYSGKKRIFKVKVTVKKHR